MIRITKLQRLHSRLLYQRNLFYWLIQNSKGKAMKVKNSKIKDIILQNVVRKPPKN